MGPHAMKLNTNASYQQETPPNKLLSSAGSAHSPIACSHTHPRWPCLLVVHILAWGSALSSSQHKGIPITDSKHPSLLPAAGLKKWAQHLAYILQDNRVEMSLQTDPRQEERKMNTKGLGSSEQLHL